MKKIFIEVDKETNRITGWSDSSFGEHCIEVEIEENEKFYNSFGNYKYADNQVVEDSEYYIELLKRSKIDELNYECNKAILNGFKHEINGVLYHFSFDSEAQLNFQGAERILSQGLVSEIMWTVKKDGKYMRIPINKTIMDELTIAILMHKDGNISKYRDFLVPLVEKTSKPEEINNIKWN